jgi:hypothetical protein
VNGPLDVAGDIAAALPAVSAAAVAAYFVAWVLRLLAAHVKAWRMRRLGVVGVHVEAGFLHITVQVPARYCGYCSAQLALTNARLLCETCQRAGVHA